MRTTLAVDDDVLSVAKEMASSQSKTVGEVISTLARSALRPVDLGQKRRNGIVPLPVRVGAPRVTSELVKQLNEELL